MRGFCAGRLTASIPGKGRRHAGPLLSSRTRSLAALRRQRHQAMRPQLTPGPRRARLIAATSPAVRRCAGEEPTAMVAGPPRFLPRAAGEGDPAQHGGGGIRAANPVRYGLMGKGCGEAIQGSKLAPEPSQRDTGRVSGRRIRGQSGRSRETRPFRSSNPGCAATRACRRALAAGACRASGSPD
jgi:hypothetical protein